MSESRNVIYNNVLKTINREIPTSDFELNIYNRSSVGFKNAKLFSIVFNKKKYIPLCITLYSALNEHDQEDLRNIIDILEVSFPNTRRPEFLIIFFSDDVVDNTLFR